MNTREYVPLDFDVHPEYGMPREAWLAARKNGIGSSDVAAILGLDRFKSPVSVYLDKIGESAPVEENDMMRWGRKLEDAVAQEFDEQHPGCDTPARPWAMFQHVEHDFMLASPDRLTFSLPHVAYVERSATGILEIKTGRNADIWEDGPPQSYVLQVLHQLEVCGLEHAHLAVLLNGRDYRDFEIERDPILAEMLVEAEAEFWQMVEERVQPDVDGHEATTEALKRLHASSTPDRTVELTAEQAEWAARYKEAKSRLGIVQLNVDECANHLRDALGDAEFGVFNGADVVTWKQSKGGKGRVDLDALEADHPALVQQYRKPAPTRRLLIK